MKQYFPNKIEMFQFYDQRKKDVDPDLFGFGLGLDDIGWYVVEYMKPVDKTKLQKEPKCLLK